MQQIIKILNKQNNALALQTQYQLKIFTWPNNFKKQFKTLKPLK